MRMEGMIWHLLAVVFLLVIASVPPTASSHQFAVDGTVLELDDSNFNSVVSSFDYVFVDFYAPWCGHCKRISPELEAAAPALAELKEPIVIAKVNADKFTHLAKKYDVDGFPTLKVFMHGVPVDYRGPRKADLLVRYLKKYVASDVSVLNSDSAIRDFIEAAGSYFPIFIGFGLEESTIKSLAIKYKKKAWFAVAKDFSEDIMVFHDFDKVPALVSLHPSYDDRSIFYGPFEEEFLEDFVKQNLLPSTLPINYDTLKLLKDADRKIVLTFMEDEHSMESKELIKLLRAAAAANRDLIFGYLGVKQWEDFADTFGVNKKVKLPKMIVWDGDEEYLTVIGSEAMVGEEEGGLRITQFLEGYKEGRTEKKRIVGPSVMGYINSLIGMRTVFLIVFVVGMIMLIQTINKDDETASRGRDDKEVDRSGIKED